MGRLLLRSPVKTVAAVFAFGLLLATGQAIAAPASLGGMAGGYLRSPAGAAALAMGGASTASPEALAPWWNPASLATLKKPQAGLGGGLRSQGRTEGYGSYEFHIPPRVGMGFALVYRGDPFINGLHDELENPLDRGTYTALTLKTGLGALITRKLSAGVSIGVFYQRLPTGYFENGSLEYSSATGIGGFDFSARYEAAKNLIFALAVRNIAAATDWQISSSATSLNVTIAEKVVPEIVLGSCFNGTLAGSPLLWNCDLAGYIWDGNGDRLAHADAVLSNGFEWQRWKSFRLRAGIGDLAINSTISGDSKQYWEDFSLRLGAGFGWDLIHIRPGLAVNYAVSSDKVWAGIDQALDIRYSF